MANASRHHVGPGAHGKGSGAGAMTELPDGVLEENMVLSNRDKSRHSQERGLDGKTVQTEQYHDHAANRRQFDALDAEPLDTNTSGNASTMAVSSETSSLASRRED